MKNNTKNPTILFLTGLAFGLQHVSKIIPEASLDLKAYLFPLASQNTKKYLEKLMVYIQQFGTLGQNSIYTCVDEYIKYPLRESDCVKEYSSLYFSTRTMSISEDSFDFDTLNPQGLLAGKTMYNENKAFFDRLISDLYHKHPLTKPDESFGLLFVQTID